MSEAIVSRPAFFTALDRAASVELSAYVLDPHSRVVRALEACGDRKAAVTVRLDGAPFLGRDAEDAAARNQRVAAELRSHGVNVVVTDAGSPVHMKAAVIDGVAYLDDRNWPNGGPDTLVTTSDPADVAVVSSAIAGTPAGDEHLATEKEAAVALEAQTIAAGSGDRIDIESETFGYSKVSKALYERACAGAAVRLLVTRAEYDAGGATERASLARLARAGVSVRVGGSTEKLCVAGDRGWAGSANPSFDLGQRLDWGMVTTDPAMLRSLQANFDRNWAGARPAV